MVSLITVPIWDKIRTRLGLIERPDTQRAFNLSHDIALTHPLKEIIGTVKTGVSTQDISGSGWVTYFTVPAKKSWEVYQVKMEGTAANTQARLNTNGEYSNVLLNALGTSELFTYFNPPLIMTENWLWQQKATGNGGDNSIDGSIIYVEFDLTD